MLSVTGQRQPKQTDILNAPTPIPVILAGDPTLEPWINRRDLSGKQEGSLVLVKTETGEFLLAVATDDGTADPWVALSALPFGGAGAVSWADITGKPSTFPPIIGTTSTTAMAGDTEIPAAAHVLQVVRNKLTSSVTTMPANSTFTHISSLVESEYIMLDGVPAYHNTALIKYKIELTSVIPSPFNYILSLAGLPGLTVPLEYSSHTTWCPQTPEGTNGPTSEITANVTSVGTVPMATRTNFVYNATEEFPLQVFVALTLNFITPTEIVNA